MTSPNPLYVTYEEVAFTNHLAAYVVELRARLGLCTRRFAGRLGVAHSLVTMVENGTREPTMGLLAKIVAAFPDEVDRAELALAVTRHLYDLAGRHIIATAEQRIAGMDGTPDADEGRAMVHSTLTSSSFTEAVGDGQ